MTNGMEEALLGLSRRVVGSVVDHPDLMELFVVGSEEGVCRILVRTGPGEVGQVIGRQGRNLEALRIIMQACARKHRGETQIELLESEGRPQHNRPSFADLSRM